MRQDQKSCINIDFLVAYACKAKYNVTVLHLILSVVSGC
jgi:hypothetical protein